MNEEPRRNSVAYSPTATMEEAQGMLASVNASDWLVFTVEGTEGTFVELKIPMGLGAFATVLSALKGDWILQKDPR